MTKRNARLALVPHRCVLSRSAMWAAVLVAQCWAIDAGATEPGLDSSGPKKSIELGLESGYALPYGKMSGASGDSLPSAVKGVVPVEGRIGLRNGPSFLGMYFQYGFARMGDFKQQEVEGRTIGEWCDTELSCSQSVIRVGLAWHVHLLPEPRPDVWLGVGTGYEFFRTGFEGPDGGSSSVTAHGFEFGQLSGGVDFRLGGGFKFGPLLKVTVAQYGTLNVSTPDGDVSGSIEDTALHGWFSVGLRGTYQIGLN